MSIRNLPRRVFYGWWVVLSCSVSGIIGGAANVYGFTVFFLPISTDLHLSRAATAFVFSVVRLEGGIEGPFVGWFIDKFGAGRLIFVGALMAGVGYVVLSQVDSFLGFLLVFVLLIGLGFNLGFGNAGMAAANSWFVRRKALAMGIIAAGFSTGGLLVPALTWAVESYGWRTAAIVLGIAIWLVVLPLSLIVRRAPEDMGLLPDGDTRVLHSGSPQNNNGEANGYTDYTTRQALRSRSYWFLVAAMALYFTAQNTILTHMVPLLVDKGMSLTTAAGAVGLLAAVGTVSRLLAGFLGDRFPKRSLLIGANLLGSLSLGLLFFMNNQWQLYFFVTLWGLAASVAYINWSIVGEYYGRKHFATIRGFANFFRTLLMVAGPVSAGWVFDTYRSYDMVVVAFALVYAAGALLYYLGRPPKAKPTPLNNAGQS